MMRPPSNDPSDAPADVHLASASGRDVPVRELVAQAYHDASLAGAPMRSAVDTLEAVRSAESAHDPYYRAWELLDREIAAANDDVLIRILTDLRASVGRALADHDRRHATDVRSWRAAFAHALCEFRAVHGSHLLSLARDMVPPPTDVDAAAAGLAAAVATRWPDTYNLVCEVAGWKEADRRDRARARVFAAQIDAFHRGNRAAALAHLAEAARLSPEDALVVTCEGRLYANDNERDKARARFERAIEIDPDLAAPHIELGDLAQSGPEPDPDEAEEWYERAVRCGQGETLAYISLLRLYQRPEWFAGNETRIQELYARALRYDLEDAAATHEEVGHVYAANALPVSSVPVVPSDRDAYLRALECYDRAIAVSPHRISAACSKALLRARAGEIDAARAECQALLTGPGGSAYAAWCLAEIDSLAERWTEVASWCRVVLESRPGWRGILLVLGRAEMMLGNLAAAESHLCESLRLKPEGGAQALLEELTTKLGTDTTAIKRVLRAILAVRGPAYEPTYFNILGNRKFEWGDYLGAVEAYEEATRRMPTSGVVWSNLAGACEQLWNTGRAAEAGREAIAALTRAAHLDPRGGYSERITALNLRIRVFERWGCDADAYFAVEPASPVVLGIASDLVEAMVGKWVARRDPTLAAAAAIEALTARLRETYGVAPRAPAMHQDSALAPGGYTISLRGYPAAAGTVPRAPWQPIADVFGAVETVIVDGLWRLLSIDDVVERVPAHAPWHDPAHVLRLWRVLRLLLRERISIVELAPILDACSADLSLRPFELVPEVRRRLAHRIDTSGTLIALGEPDEGLIRRSIVPSKPSLLALAPEDCQRLLRGVRERVGDRSDAALLVEDSRLRLLVRRLVEVELPRLRVLARDELPAGGLS